MNEKPLNVLTVIPIVLIAFTVLVTVVFFGWWSMKERFVFGHETFDQVRWMTPATSERPCDRGDMVLDLQQHLLTPGMNRTEVMRLLGRPAWEDPAQIEYELGVCLWVVHGLRLYFDPDGRLTHSTIVQH